jgi:phosphatidate cytidylyltransferase
MIGALIEFSVLFRDSIIRLNIWLIYIFSAILFILSFFIAGSQLQAKYFLLISPMFLLIMGFELYRKLPNPIENIAVTLFGIIYISLPLSLSNFLVFPEIDSSERYSPQLLVALFILIWVYDSGAYLVGISIGKHRLMERISPKKSWEGAIGGLIAALIAAYFISGFIPEIPLYHWMVIGLLVVIASTFGDLTESMIKRFFQIKDSGKLLPGHGGILDRFDSLVFAIPIFVIYLKLLIE